MLPNEVGFMMLRLFGEWLSHYKRCIKCNKHLKTAEFAKNAYEGLHFSAKLKAKGWQVYGQETFSYVLLWPFLNQISEICSYHLFSSSF